MGSVLSHELLLNLLINLLLRETELLYYR